jgi:hypothetical protein
MDDKKLRETVGVIDSIAKTVDPTVATMCHTGMRVVYQHLDNSYLV